jgi:hypothetical protein
MGGGVSKMVRDWNIWIGKLGFDGVKNTRIQEINNSHF